MSQGSVTLSYVAGKQRPFTRPKKDGTGTVDFIDYGVKIGTDQWYSFVQFANQDAPVAGDKIEGVEIIPNEKYNDQIRGKLVRSVTAGEPSSNGATSTNTGPPADARQNSIVRQHSQEMAIRWLAIQPKASAYSLEDLREVIAWFEKDAWGDTPEAPERIEVSSKRDDDIPF